MTEIEIKNKLDPLLKDLASHKTLETAEILISQLMKLIEVETSERKLLNIPKIDYEIHRFQSAPSFLKQAAAYEIPNSKNDFLDLKLYWLKKTTKTNLSWVIGLTPNFEDSAANDFENIGIDFVVPESGDSLIILLSKQYKIRSLEIKDHITSTQAEIFKAWSSIKHSAGRDIASAKASSHDKLWDSFNFEPINKKFYLDLVESFSLLVHHLETSFGKKPSVMFTTRLIGRLLFVWFLKKKNLINASINYFETNEHLNQNEFYKNNLEILFYEVLNQEISQRNNEDKITPYLNGGLFDINPTDFYKDSKLTFPNGFFNHLFNTLNKYNFTVDESSPEFQHVAIDPEMLGRIFESLLAEQIDDSTGDNKKKTTGAFYTPREIVSYMCEEAMIQFLKSKVPYSPDRDRKIEELIRLPETIFRDQDSNKRRDWKPYSESIIAALEGSAKEMPVTILDPAVGSGAFPMGMLHLLVKIYSRLDVKYEKNISQLKRRILSKSIYGADIEPTAIEICRLRAWLSIIVDVAENDLVEPLPNLDFKFTCANTLIPLADEQQESFFEDQKLKEKLMEIRDDYFNSSNKVKKEKLQIEYEKLTHNDDLFDSKKVKQLKSYKPFNITNTSSFYDPKLHHGVEFFNIVIGNPPYVSVKKINADTKKEFTKIYETGKGRLNLFTLFIERGFKLIKTGGNLTFIIPENLFSNIEYRHTREYLTKHSTILLACRFSKRVFKAAVDTAIIVVQNNKENIPVKIFKDITQLTSTFTQDELKIPPGYLFPFMVESNAKELISKIQNSSDKKFSNYLEIQQGIIYSGQSKEDVFSNEKINDSYKKVLDGRDIDRYIINWNSKAENKYIKYTSDLHRARDERIFLAKNKIVLPRKSTKLICAIDNDQYYLLNTAYVILSKIDSINMIYILSLLNSKLFDFYYQSLYFGWQVTIPAINSLPIIFTNQIKEQKIVELTKAIISNKQTNPSADLSIIKSQIDDLIFEVYGLDENEINLIKSSNLV
jgi:hypothetical protein